MANCNRLIVMNHYGITPDMPGATRNYDLAKYISEHTDYETEFWRCSVGHYVEDKGSRVSKPKVYEDGHLRVRGIWSVSYQGNSIRRFLNMVIFDLNTALKILLSRRVKYVIMCVPPINIFNIVAMRLRGIKLIVDVEDLWPLFLEEMGVKNRVLLGSLRIAANYTYKAATAISAVSNGMLSYVRNSVNTDNKITWLSPLGVDIDKYTDATMDESIFEKYEWVDDFVVMYIGAMGPANDLISVLRTVAEYNKIFSSIVQGKRLSFVFIGNGSSKEEMCETHAKLGLANVFIEDGIPASLVPKFLLRADVCLTNLKKIDSFKLVRPNKLFQYMAAQKPILCGIWGEMQEIVTETNAGIYVDFTNTTKAAESINCFMNRTDHHEMGQQGYKYVLDHGNRECIFKETVSVLEALEQSK